MGVGDRAAEIARKVLGAEVSAGEAAGLFAAIGSIGPSFQRGLLPRATAHQAGITGVVAAANYGLTTTTQSFVEAFAHRVTGGRDSTARRSVILAVDAVAFGAAIAAQRLAAQQPGEPLRRATVRTAAWRVALGAVAGAIVTAVDAATDRLTSRDSPATVNGPAVVLAGSAFAAGAYVLQRRAMVTSGVETDASGKVIEDAGTVVMRRAVLTGAGVSAALFAVSRVESLLARGIGAAVGWAAPGLAPVGTALGHAGALGLFGYAGYRVVHLAYGRTEQAGTAIEPAYQDKPRSALVSGGPGSLVDFEDIGREGRRYVNMALTAEEIREVTGTATARDPIRVFVGLASAETPGERVDLAMRELERTGAFDRPLLAVFSPTGTGYVNYVAAEALEYLTGGDVASVAIQYSVRPSFLSLDRVRTAWEGNLAFLSALSWRLRAIPEERRPRLVMFGESLGSQAGQDVFLRQGARGLELMGIDRALFIGSPYASRWRREWLADPGRWDPDGRIVEVDSYDEWLALPVERRDAARVVLLTHHLDPIPKFGAPVLIQAPPWLGPPEARAPGIPREVHWRPIVTFVITLVDLLNADHVKPGVFEAFGHDYRKDLTQAVRLAFALPVGDDVVERVERALRARELHWAQERLVTAQLQKAEDSVRQQLATWGVDTDAIPSVVTVSRDVSADPYAAPAATRPTT